MRVSIEEMSIEGAKKKKKKKKTQEKYYIENSRRKNICLLCIFRGNSAIQREGVNIERGSVQ